VQEQVVTLNLQREGVAAPVVPVTKPRDNKTSPPTTAPATATATTPASPTTAPATTKPPKPPAPQLDRESPW
jgi:hypothetical protein